MTRSLEEAQQLWAREQFRDYGDDVQDTDEFYIDSTTIYGGYCETCSYETAGYELINLRTKKRREIEIGFSDLMRELEKYSKDED